MIVRIDLIMIAKLVKWSHSKLMRTLVSSTASTVFLQQDV